MIEINLIPDVKQQLINAQRMRTTVISLAIIIGIVTLGIVVVLAVYSYGVQTVRSSILDGQIDEDAKKLSAFEDLSKTLTIQNQLALLPDTHADKKISSRMFDVLAKIIPPSPNDVQFSNFVVDTSEQTVTIEGQAKNSYAAVEVFKKTISAAEIVYVVDGEDRTTPLATDISTGEMSYGEDSSGTRVLRFTLSFGYADELFDSSATDVRIRITNQGNATDSYLGVPESIFVDPASDVEGEN